MKRALLILIALAMLPASARCATRFYFNSTTAPAVSPAVNADWSNADNLVRRKMATTKASTAISDFYGFFGGAGVPFNKPILVQFVSDPIGAQSVSGTVSLVVKAAEISASDNAVVRTNIRLYHSDGSFGGTLLGATNAGTEVGTGSGSTRILSGTSLSTQTASNGDRIVVEFGVTATSVDGDYVTQRYGDNNASDFALTSGLTTDLNPWIEFSGTIAPATASNTSAFFQLLGLSERLFRPWWSRSLHD